MNDDQPIIDTGLLPWATATQRKYLESVNLLGGYRKAAAAHGIANHSTLVRSIQGLQRRAALHGYAPANDLTHVAAPGFLTKRVSTYHQRTDTAPAQWHIQEPDKAQAFAVIREWIEGLTEDIQPRAPVVPPSYTDSDLMCVIPMGDPHFGMYAWKDEAGEDFDLGIAERITCAAVSSLVASAPDAGTGVLLNLGDMFHADNESNQTARSGNALDVDTRWPRVMQIGLRAMEYCVERMLEKFSKVIVRVCKGNHDGHSSFALALALDRAFRNEPRVTVDLSPATHWYLKFGSVMIGSTHGDTTRMNDLPGVMFTDQRKNLADVDHCYWYCGHIHHEKVQEFPGVVVEYFRTLAPRDAWHSASGYRAGRDMRLIVLHRRFGEIARNRRDIAMIEAEA